MKSIDKKQNYFKIINMDGVLKLENVLFVYEDINSTNLYIVSENNDELYITYELHFNATINKAIWLGESNDDVVKNGKLVECGEMFLGTNNTIKRKLIRGELNHFLSKEYHFEA